MAPGKSFNLTVPTNNSLLIWKNITIIKKSQSGYAYRKVICEWQKEIPELPTTAAEDTLGYQ